MRAHNIHNRECARRDAYRDAPTKRQTNDDDNDDGGKHAHARAP